MNEEIINTYHQLSVLLISASLTVSQVKCLIQCLSLVKASNLWLFLIKKKKKMSLLIIDATSNNLSVVTSFSVLASYICTYMNMYIFKLYIPLFQLSNISQI